jgi:hypothetical protein
LAGALTVLLYQTEITDIDAWSNSISKTSLDLIELWSTQWGLDDLRNKTKFHHLAHSCGQSASKLQTKESGGISPYQIVKQGRGTWQGIQFLAQEGI